MKNATPKALLALFLLLSISAWSSTEKPKASVLVSKVAASDIFDSLNYPARVVSKVNTSILAEVDGVVSRILAPLGKSVSAKEKILVISHTDPVYSFAPVQIRTPVAGVVSSLEVTEGTQVIKGQKLGSVTDPRQVRLIVEVPALDVPKFTQGLTGELMVAGREKTLLATVRGISPFVDPATGTSTCELELEKSAVLPPGTVGQVSFKTNSRKGFSIADSAVIYRGTENYVRLVQDGKIKKVAVVLGRKQRGTVEVLKGINDGAQVVERASRFVSDGEAVDVQTQ